MSDAAARCGEVGGVEAHAPLGTAEGQLHEGTLPRHPHGQRRRLSQADLGLITDAAFRRPHGQHVLYAVAENRLHMVLIVTTERKGDDLSSLRVEKPLTQIVAASSTATP